MITTGSFEKKRILLIDKDRKQSNDRTWCYWEQQPGFFEGIVYKSWKQLAFLSDDYAATFPIDPYQYKMIRGIDFYQYCFSIIASQDNIEVVYGDISSCKVKGKTAQIVLGGVPLNIQVDCLFNSVYIPVPRQKNSLRLLQHFKGWIIETNEDRFDPAIATFMDFRVSQNEGTTFAYVLPFTAKSALVEYTLFSRQLLEDAGYEQGLSSYIVDKLGISDYKIVEKESGVIPMTNERFSFNNNGWQLGTAGGQTKASSGYTFQFIQKQSDKILAQLLAGNPLEQISSIPRRFSFYDHTLLHILYHNTVAGKKIFTKLFQKNKPQQVLRFLDNESSIKEELKLISSLPAWPFLKAGLKQL